MESIVTIRVLHENKLKTGDVLTEGMVAFPESFYAEMDGQPQEFIFLDDAGHKAKTGLVIQGTREFDMSRPIDVKNFNTAQIFLRLYPEVNQQLQIINPEKDAEISLKRNILTGQLITLVATHANDPDWLAKVYRRVIGLASGLTSQVLLNSLMETAKTNVEAFVVGRKIGGLLVFETEFFEYESLLDIALERGLLVKDGDYINRADGSIYALDRAKAVYLLREDPTFRYHLQQQIAQLTPSLNQPATASVEKRIEDSDLLEMARELGTPLATPAFTPSGSVDQRTEDQRIDEARYGLVDKLIESDLIKTDEITGELVLPDYGNIHFLNKSEAVGYLKANPEVEMTLASMFTL